MEYAQPLPRPGAGRIWIAVGVMAVSTVGSMALSKAVPLTGSAIALSTWITAASVMAIAAVMAPATPYPRWSHWASAGVLAAWVLVGPRLAGSPEAWKADVRENMWFMPWFMLTAASMPRRLEGACPTVGMRAGWIMVAASVFLGGILMLAEQIARTL